MKYLLFLSFILLLYSCATLIVTIPLNHREYDGLKEGIIYKDLGEPLIVKGTEEYANGIILNKSINDYIVNPMSGFEWIINLSSEEVLYYGAKDETRDFYFSERIIPQIQTPTKQGVGINRKTNQKFIVIAQNNNLVAKEFDFNYGEEDYQSKNCDVCFKKELIYNGKSENTIKLIYREFFNDMARPAFTQNLTYDLSEGSIISFLGCKIEVMSAKNTGIEFKILSSFKQ